MKLANQQNKILNNWNFNLKDIKSMINPKSHNRRILLGQSQPCFPFIKLNFDSATERNLVLARARCSLTQELLRTNNMSMMASTQII